MDPMTIIVTALIAGAAAGGQDAVSAAVRDSYSALRSRIGGNARVRATIQANEVTPGRNIPALEEALRDARATDDDVLLESAERLLDALPAGHLKIARCYIDARDAKGVQVGDRNTQHNTFN